VPTLRDFRRVGTSDDGIQGFADLTPFPLPGDDEWGSLNSMVHPINADAWASPLSTVRL
jgi:hypothetical protein